MNKSRRAPGLPIKRKSEFRVGMLVESYRVGTCRVIDVGEWIQFEYVGILCHNGERQIFQNGDPVKSDGKYLFRYASPDATLD